MVVNMAVRVHELTLTTHPLRWLALPALSCWDVTAAACGRLWRTACRSALEPSLPRMSDDWLRRYEAEERPHVVLD